MGAPFGDGFHETWQIQKPAVASDNGIVVSQHYLASVAGAKALREGGNAVDAAVTTALYLGTVEPWMSGIGGGGVMMVYLAREDRCYAVDFTMVAPRGLDPSDYPLASAGDSGDLFGWPAVENNTNVYGPLSFAIPGNVAGLALALERFGTVSFANAITPAVEQARAGMPVDWYATLKIASGAKTLACYPESAKTYLPEGHVPCGEWGGPLPHIRLGALADTLKTLRQRGPDDFYQGELAQRITRDMVTVGAKPTAADFAQYAANVVDIPASRYRDHRIYTAPGLTAGPTMDHALAELAQTINPAGAAPSEPPLSTYEIYANTLADAYEHRLRTLGDNDESRSPGCTTHLSVADKDGNVVALTQTLLSIFGSKVMLPQTGILWNNGIMWFDPRPGRRNSIAAGKRPLSNMCPTIVARSDGTTFGLGASGGRRIFPAVFQLTSFLTDYHMDLNQAFHTPRVDVSAAVEVSVDRQLPAELVARLRPRHNAVHATHGVYPALYACPNGVAATRGGGQQGCAFVMSPWSKAIAPHHLEPDE